jgi:DNA ligase D-like protein (predicted polymerase)
MPKGARKAKLPAFVAPELATLAEPASRAKPSPATHVRLSHPDRVLWPEAGITKQGLADHYTSVWPFMERHVTGRPLALVRCPAGISQGCFFQKHEWNGMDAHVKRIADPHDKEKIVGIEDLDGLIALVQASVLEIHPWGVRFEDLDHPDRLIFDLDPGPGVAIAELVAAARLVRDRLEAQGLASFVKTTGGKGLHVVAPLEPAADWDAAKGFSRALAKTMAREDSGHFTATMTKSRRGGRIYVDYLRNGRGATAVCAYSTRARPKAGIATPLTWDELDDLPLWRPFHARQSRQAPGPSRGRSLGRFLRDPPASPQGGGSAGKAAQEGARPRQLTAAGRSPHDRARPLPGKPKSQGFAGNQCSASALTQAILNATLRGSDGSGQENGPRKAEIDPRFRLDGAGKTARHRPQGWRERAQ